MNIIDKIESIAEISSSTKEKLLAYVDLLTEERKIRNIIGSPNKEIIINDHILPSVQLAKTIKEGRGVDIGSGNGLPGIVLSIVSPDKLIVLMEPKSARVDFLRKTIKTLDIRNVDILQLRAEEAGQDTSYRSKYEFVTCRAVAEFPVALELVMPLLALNGSFYAQLGKEYERIIAESSKYFLTFGAQLGNVSEDIAVIKKIARIDSGYPRSWNKIKRHR